MLTRLTRFVLVLILAAACNAPETSSVDPVSEKILPKPDFTLTAQQTHNRFSATIPPVITVPSGSVIEAYTEDASDEQLSLDSQTGNIADVSFDPIHPITGPVYVEGAQPGDVLAVKLA